MRNEKELKDIVKDKYAQIAVEADKSLQVSCCGGGEPKTSSSCCGETYESLYTVFGDDYSKLSGYVPDADLGLGCGLPTEFAGLKEGQTVVDLGSGAGNDVFVARSFVGDSGKVIGIDFTPEMIEKAERNKAKAGFTNIEFKLGEIEDMPLENSVADVIISNCVLNLVPNKDRTFSEIHRILKDGGHICVSDIVIFGELPEKAKESAALYAGCVSGALPEEEYISKISNAGLKNIEIRKSRNIVIPDSALEKYLTKEELERYHNSEFGIKSITVTADK